MNNGRKRKHFIANYIEPGLQVSWTAEQRSDIMEIARHGRKPACPVDHVELSVVVSPPWNGRYIQVDVLCPVCRRETYAVFPQAFTPATDIAISLR